MPENYLATHPEEMPRWLSEYKDGDPFPRNFFQSRVVYYPGSGNDGHPVRVFNSTRSAHCYLYADYGVSKNNIIERLTRLESAFRGYEVISKIDVRKAELTPNPFIPRFVPHQAEQFRGFAHATPFALLVVFQRLSSYDHRHGAERFAVLFLAADGFAAYEAVFCQQELRSPPFAIKLQDHGFGGNYDRFGAGGIMEDTARHYGVWPQLLLVGDNTEPWIGYEKVVGTGVSIGGYNANRCRLFEKIQE